MNKMSNKLMSFYSIVISATLVYILGFFWFDKLLIHIKSKSQMFSYGYLFYRNETEVPMCQLEFNCSSESGLPREDIDFTPYEFDIMNKEHPSILKGGIWSPKDCKPLAKVVIIVPFYNRTQHLRVFINNIIPLLQRQKVAFRIFVIEQQTSETLFSKAILLNIGYLEALKLGYNDCFIFHDVDYVPLNWCNFYNCSGNPRHLCVVSNKFKTLIYPTFFGGGMALSNKTINSINGFSNIYYGWGGEDDDAYLRLAKNGYRILRYSEKIAKYWTVDHKRKAEPLNPKVQRSFKVNWKYFPYDGLSTVNYTLINKVLHPLYTNITVSFKGPSDKKEAAKYFLEKSKLFLQLYMKTKGKFSDRKDGAKYLVQKSNLYKSYMEKKRNSLHRPIKS